MDKGQKLFRSRSDRLISGVCGGLAVHFQMDPTLVRIIFVLLALLSGAGLILYLILAIIVPSEEKADSSPREAARQGAEELAETAKQVAGKVQQAAKVAGSHGAFLAGLVLVMLGVWFLLQNLGFHLPWWLDFGVIWPALLIAIGLLLLLRKARQDRARGD